MIITSTDILLGLLGGALIGLASAILWIGLGRIAGISGIFSGILFSERGDRYWRVAFILGLILAGSLFGWLFSTEQEVVVSLKEYILTAVAGLLVGFGAVLGSGCTSGHGVCGLSRLSLRSFVAIALFMLSGFVAVTLLRLFIV